MSDKKYFSKFNDGESLRYVKDEDVRGVVGNTEGFKTFEDNEFTYRKSGGDNDIETGLASIERIKGNTVAWNQLVNKDTSAEFHGGGLTGSFSNGVWTYSGTPTAADIAVLPIGSWGKVLAGHKYFLSAVGNKSDINVRWASYGSTVEGFGQAVGITQFNNNSNDLEPVLSVTVGTAFSASLSYIAIDLTLMFGEGNEPTTVEQFEADYLRWFGKPLTYEEYDAGSLRPVLMSGIKTTGFNQWDEEWVNGYWSDNSFYPSLSQVCPKNFIPCLPNTTYFFKRNGHAGNIYAYDSNKQPIAEMGAWSTSDISFTTPANAAFLMFYYNGTTYNHDICINISNPSKNGTYEPYQGNTRTLDVTTLKGKLNGSGNSVVIFPDGLKKAGNVQDEIFVEDGKIKGVVRTNKIILNGSEDWHFVQEVNSFHLPTILSINDGTQIPITNRYIGQYGKEGFPDNKCAKLLNGMLGFAIHDDSFSSIEEWKSYLSENPLTLVYALQTPETYILDDNLIDYPVNKYGTEEILSLPNAVSPILDINYPVKSFEALHTLPKDYISTKDLNTLLDKLGESTGFKITKIWNSKTNSYEFKYCIAPQGDVQVFADPECTRYATGLATKVYVRLNRDYGFGEGNTIGPSPENSVSVSCPQEGTSDDPYLIMTYVDYISENFTEPFKAGQVVECNLAVNQGVYDVSEFDKIFTYIPEFVDLGLPSGTIWAKYNLGTTGINYPGKYFSWGNINGVTSQDPSAITQAAYPNTPGAGLTGNIPNNVEYDAALVELGSLWSIPTQEQWKELYDNCTWTWDNIRKGYTISRNGNSMFLYAGGDVSDGVVYEVGVSGSYWSKSYVDGSACSALTFNSSSVNPQNTDMGRFLGCCIRPVINR